MTFYINEEGLTKEVVGKNVFRFRYNAILQDNYQRAYDLKATFEPYAYAWNGTREQLVSGTGYSCDVQ